MRSYFIILAILLALPLAVYAQEAGLDQLKPLYPRFELAADGRAEAVIVCPPDAELQAAGSALSDEIAELSGARLDAISDTDLVAEDWQIDHALHDGRNIIALGSCNDSCLLAVLFRAGYTAESSDFPGTGVYVVRTVHDPFANGTNVLVLAGSDAAGVRRAVEVLLEKYAAPRAPGIVLEEPIVDVEFVTVETSFFPTATDWASSKRQPQYSTIQYFQDLFSSSGLMDAEGNVIRREDGDLVTVLGAIGRLGQSWFWNGDPALPPLMKEILDKNRHLLANVPRRVEMEGAASAHMQWWDIVEELPVWTDADRLEITNAFLADARQGYEQRAANQLVREGAVQVVDENHGTNSALNTFAGWNYFDRYYDLPESEYWMNVARAVFSGQSCSFQVLEDAAGYLCYAPRHAMSYALSSGDLTYFTRGIARSQAEYIAQACMNNLGYASGFGDCTSLVEPGIFEAISLAAWYYRDPRLNWVMQTKLPQACGLRTFQYPIPYDLSVELQEPSEWTGMSVFPIYQQTLAKGESSTTPVFDPPESAGPEWFNKIVFREGWTPDDQYLLLDGAGKFTDVEGYPNGPAGHMQSDVNSIINFTAEGRMWLVDHTYSARGIQDHSGLYIARDGAIAVGQHEAKLQEAADGGSVALSRSIYEGFSGVDWERTIFWRPGRPFVVLDRAIAREPGHYVVRCSFRGLGEPALVDSRLRLAQDGRYCDIIADGQSRTDLEMMTFPTPEAWQDYTFAEPVARIFQQDRSAVLEPGQSLNFATAVHAAQSAEELDAVSLTRVSDSAVLMQDGASRSLYGIGTVPGDTADAGSYAIDEAGALFGGLRRLGPADDPLLTASAPVSLFMAAGEDGWIEAGEPVELHLRGREDAVRLTAGRHELPASPTASAVTALTEAAMAEAVQMAAAGYAQNGGGDDEAPFGWDAAAVELGTGATEAKSFDLDGDGANEWLIAGEEGVSAFRPDGELIWRFAPGAPCRTVDAGDVNGDGAPEVAVGCDDTSIYLLSPAGEQLWSYRCEATTGSIGFPAWVDWVRITDLEPDGRPEIIAGANQVHCLDGAGSLKWERYLRVARGMTCGDFMHGAITDLDGDGSLEVLAMFLYSYHQALAFNAQGDIVLPPDYDNDHKFGVNIDLPQGLLVTKAFGEGDTHFALAGATRMYVYWGSGPHIGYPGWKAEGSCVALAVWEPEGEPPIIFNADNMGTVTARRSQPARGDEWLFFDTVWNLVTGRKVTRLDVADTDADGEPELLIGMKDGAVQIVNALTGEPEARSSASGSAVVGFYRDGEDLLVLHSDGQADLLKAAQ